MSFHLVICRAGETREFVREVEMHDATREAVINDLIAEAYDQPLRVLEIEEPVNANGFICANSGRCDDVSEDVAREILHRVGMRGDLDTFWNNRDDLMSFCHEHAGIQATNETMQATE